MTGPPSVFFPRPAGWAAPCSPHCGSPEGEPRRVSLRDCLPWALPLALAVGRQCPWPPPGPVRAWGGCARVSWAHNGHLDQGRTALGREEGGSWSVGLDGETFGRACSWEPNTPRGSPAMIGHPCGETKARKFLGPTRATRHHTPGPLVPAPPEFLPV